MSFVVGVGIAEKVVGGGPTGQLGVTVFVKEKVSPRKVSDRSARPGLHWRGGDRRRGNR
jgi:hypothetical protein